MSFTDCSKLVTIFKKREEIDRELLEEIEKIPDSNGEFALSLRQFIFLLINKLSFSERAELIRYIEQLQHKEE